MINFPRSMVTVNDVVQQISETIWKAQVYLHWIVESQVSIDISRERDVSKFKVSHGATRCSFHRNIVKVNNITWLTGWSSKSNVTQIYYGNREKRLTGHEGRFVPCLYSSSSKNLGSRCITVENYAKDVIPLTLATKPRRPLRNRIRYSL